MSGEVWAIVLILAFFVLPVVVVIRRDRVKPPEVPHPMPLRTDVSTKKLTELERKARAHDIYQLAARRLSRPAQDELARLILEEDAKADSLPTGDEL